MSHHFDYPEDETLDIADAFCFAATGASPDFDALRPAHDDFANTSVRTYVLEVPIELTGHRRCTTGVHRVLRHGAQRLGPDPACRRRPTSSR